MVVVGRQHEPCLQLLRRQPSPSTHPEDVSDFKFDVSLQVANPASSGPLSPGGPNLVVLGIQPMDSQAFEHGKGPTGTDRIYVYPACLGEPPFLEMGCHTSSPRCALTDVQASAVRPVHVDAVAVSDRALVPPQELLLLRIAGPALTWPDP